MRLRGLGALPQRAVVVAARREQEHRLPLRQCDRRLRARRADGPAVQDAVAAFARDVPVLRLVGALVLRVSGHGRRAACGPVHRPPPVRCGHLRAVRVVSGSGGARIPPLHADDPLRRAAGVLSVHPPQPRLRPRAVVEIHAAHELRRYGVPVFLSHRARHHDGLAAPDRPPPGRRALPRGILAGEHDHPAGVRLDGGPVLLEDARRARRLRHLLDEPESGHQPAELRRHPVVACVSGPSARAGAVRRIQLSRPRRAARAAAARAGMRHPPASALPARAVGACPPPRLAGPRGDRLRRVRREQSGLLGRPARVLVSAALRRVRDHGPVPRQQPHLLRHVLFPVPRRGGALLQSVRQPQAPRLGAARAHCRGAAVGHQPRPCVEARLLRRAHRIQQPVRHGASAVRGRTLRQAHLP